MGLQRAAVSSLNGKRLDRSLRLDFNLRALSLRWARAFWRESP